MRTLALGVILCLTVLAIVPMAPAATSVAAIDPEQRSQLLKAREAVWRAWFGNDQDHLKKVLPDDTLAINNGEDGWEGRDEVLKSAAQFAADGGRLLRLEFPRTEIQCYGDVAVLYSRFLTEVNVHGQRTISTGRATEVFVRRDGQWLNSGWHLDSGK